VVQLVDSLDLSTNVELLNGLVQVLDGRVLGVTSEDELSLSGPNQGEVPRQRAPLKAQASMGLYMRDARGLQHQNATNAFGLSIWGKTKALGVFQGCNQR
jgi:hypothetical protein